MVEEISDYQRGLNDAVSYIESKRLSYAKNSTGSDNIIVRRDRFNQILEQARTLIYVESK